MNPQSAGPLQLAINGTFWPFRTPKQELVRPKDPVPEKQRQGVWYTASLVASAHGRTLYAALLD